LEFTLQRAPNEQSRNAGLNSNTPLQRFYASSASISPPTRRRFALEHGAELGYVAGYESALAELIKNHSVKFGDDWLQVEWTLEPGDFPAMLKSWSSSFSLSGPDTLKRELHTLLTPFCSTRIRQRKIQ